MTIRTAILLALSAGVLFSQGGSSSVTGVVTDATGAVVPNATVAVLNTSTGVVTNARSNAAGVYQTVGLVIGSYNVRVEAPGFKTFTKSAIALETGQIARVDVMLEVGSSQETVTVTAEAPLLQQETASYGTQVGTEMLNRLPYQVGSSFRNATAFIRLTPGANGTSGSAGNAVIAGGRTFASEMLVDGVPVTYNASQSVGDASTPPMDTIAEFRVEAVIPPAEHGRTSGGVIVMTSRSGSNALHGNLFSLFRNGKFDARRFNAARADQLRQAEFGAGIGGPVWIPKVYDGHNRTFFFFNYSGFRRAAVPQASIGTVATARMRAGDFGESPQPIFDPLTANASGQRLQFPGNRIPADRFSPIAVAIQKLVPDANAAGLSANYIGLVPSTEDSDSWFIKADHNLTDNHRLSGTYRPQKRTRAGTVGPFDSEIHKYIDSPITKSATLADDLILAPNLVNRVQLGLTWFTNPRRETLGDIGLGVPGAFRAGLPAVTFASQGLTQLATDNDRAPVNYSWYIQEALSWNRGKHNFKFGGRFDRYKTNNRPRTNEEGTYTFSQFATAQPGVNNTGHAYASYLLGLVHSATLQKILGEVSESYYGALYTQDDWKITRRLTINWGLRWEAQVPWSEPNGLTSIMDPTLPNPGAGGRPGAIVFGGDGEGRSGGNRFMKAYFGGFGPRLGLAYQVGRNTVVRTGAGLFYSGLVGQDLNRLGFNASTSIGSQDGGITPVFQIDRGWPSNLVRLPPTINPTVGNGTSVQVIEGRRGGSGRLPRTSQWQFGIQHTVRNILFDASYVGTVAHGITNSSLVALNQLHPDVLGLGALLTRNINDATVRAQGYLPPYAGFTGTLAQALRPFPQFQNVTLLDGPTGNSTYHALFLKTEKRFSNGLQFLASYTFSKLLSDVSISRDEYTRPQDQFNRRAEKSIANLDMSNRLVASYVYEIPLGRGRRWARSGVLSHVIGGWGLSGIHTFQAGNPLRITVPNSLPIFNGHLRPNRVEGVDMFSSPGRGNFEPLNASTGQRGDFYLNRSAFATPAAYTLGTLGVYLPDLRGPGTINEDVSILKSFRFLEGHKMEFRGDFFNAFNRRNLNDPVTELTDANFGRITGQKSARMIQLGFRYEF